MESLAAVIFFIKQVNMLMVSVTGKFAKSNFGEGEEGGGGCCRKTNDLLTMFILK
jgi:hypothetical protein